MKGQTGAAGEKTASSQLTVRWMETTQRHDYPAAASYLSLLAGPSKVRRLVSALRTAPVARFKAEDLLRASGLSLLPADDIEVAKDLAQIHAGNPLSRAWSSAAKSVRGTRPRLPTDTTVSARPTTPMKTPKFPSRS